MVEQGVYLMQTLNRPLTSLLICVLPTFFGLVNSVVKIISQQLL